MSIHSSLKSASGALQQHRNVLTRAERIARLTESQRFDPSNGSALSLPKVRSIKVAAGKKPKKTEGEAAEGGAAAPAAAAPAAKDAKAAKSPAKK
ncbi:MAG: small basic protein [Phycisphaerae bacterium]|nr:small basic protein [Phycisphaerae bacterium]